MTEIEWLPIQAGRVTIGDSRGALMFVNNGPLHQINIVTDFEISSTPITYAQWATLTGQPAAGNKSDEQMNCLTPLMIESALNSFENIRLPSEGEWALAAEQSVILKGDFQVELLADRPPRGGYWGAPCDGRPWSSQRSSGGIGDHSAHVTRVWANDDTVRGATPRGVTRQQMGFRLVRFSNEAYMGDPPRLPNAPPKSELLMRESIIALLIGILPSFTWAWFNASRSYLVDSWLNIAVGGIFFSLMTAFLWRPRTPSYRIGTNCGKVKRIE